MKKNKKIKLALNKETIAKLDNDDLKNVIGGDDSPEFLSIFNCSKTPSCQAYCQNTITCTGDYTSCFCTL